MAGTVEEQDRSRTGARQLVPTLRSRTEPTEQPLIGRRHELEQLSDALRALGEGESRAVALVGEPGIGKTRLLAELCEMASARGCAVARGRAAEYEREVPFGVIFDALYAVAGNRLASDEPLRVGSLVDVIMDLAPIVLALDDLHWADEATTKLVAYLLRERPDRPLLLLAAFRPRREAGSIARALAAAVRQGRAVCLEIGPLSRVESNELLDSELPTERRSALYGESGGNPLLLTELARSAARARCDVSHEVRARDPGDEEDLPEAVRAMIEEELAGVSPRARTLLDAAAVVGWPFTFELAALVAGLEDREAQAALDDLLDRSLVRKAAWARGYVFRHPVVWQAVYRAIPAGRLLSAHQRASVALAGAGAPLAQRAPHVERSASVGDREAIRLLVDVAKAASQLAPRAASHWFGAALRLLPHQASNERVDILLPLAASLVAQGRLAEAHSALRDALMQLPEELPGSRARTLEKIMDLEHRLGRHADVEKLRQEVLGRLPTGAAVSRRLNLALALDSWLIADWDGMATHATQASLAARRVRDPSRHADAAVLLALAEYGRGNLEAARSETNRVEQFLGELSNEELARRLWTPYRLGVLLTWLEEYQRAAEQLRRVEKISHATGQVEMLVPLNVAVGLVALARGRLEECAASAGKAIDGALRTDDVQWQVFGHVIRCSSATLMGELTKAVQAGDEAVDAADRLRTPAFTFRAECARAAALLECGDADAARSAILAGAGGRDLVDVDLGARPQWFELLVRAELAGGRLEPACDWLERAERIADLLGLPGRLGEARRARALWLLASGDAGRAAAVALEAIGRFDQVGRRLDAALARTIHGRALLAANHIEAGAAALEFAASELHRCRADRYRAEVARELRQLGTVVASGEKGVPGTHGRDALSARERQVAQLITIGRTNREIAAELCVSEKTIEKHVSRLFGKLQVRSRAAVPRVLETQLPD